MYPQKAPFKGAFCPNLSFFIEKTENITSNNAALQGYNIYAGEKETKRSDIAADLIPAPYHLSERHSYIMKMQSIFNKGVLQMKGITSDQGRQTLEKFKIEAANEVGVNLKNGYNGDLTSREAGSVGGQMVKKMIDAYKTGNVR